MKKITLFIKSYMSLVCLFILLTTLSIVGAQQSSAQQVSGVKIASLTQSVDSSNTVLRVQYVLENKTEDFLNDLKIHTSLFRAKDKKQYDATGSVLDDTDYVLSFSDDISQVVPQETYKGTLEIPLPKNIDTGNYYLNFQIQNEDGTLGLSWITEKPVELKGTGGYIYIPTASVLYKDSNYNLLEGKEQQAVDGFMVGFVRGESSRFDTLVDAKKIAAHLEVIALSTAGNQDGKKIIYTDTIALGKQKVGDVEYNTFSIPAQERIAAGSYDVNITLKQSEQVLTTDVIIARWLVDGFVGRIGEVMSGTNVIQKGPIDLRVDIHGKNGQDKQVELKAVFKNESGAEILTLSEPVLFASDTESVQIDFSDKKSTQAKKEKVSLIELTLISGETILDTTTYSVQSEQEFIKTVKKNMLPLAISVIVGLLIVAILIHVFVHKDTSPSTTTLLVVLIASTVFTLVSVHDAFARRNTTPKATTTYVIVEDKVSDINGISRLQNLSQGPSGNLGTCPQTTTVAFAGWHACPHCANGINITMTLNAKVFNSLNGTNFNNTSYSPAVTKFPGGMGNNFGTPIFTHTLTLTDANPKIEYSVKGVSSNWGHGFCLGSEKTSTTQTVSCTPKTPPENPPENPPACNPAVDPNCTVLPPGQPTLPPTTGGGISCPSDQKYCSSSGRCIANTQTCPQACGTPIVPAGGGLSATTPNMCAPGFVPVASSIFARPSTNKWYWTCLPADTTVTGASGGQCESACPRGTFYEGSKGYCAAECPDWCPNIEGSQTSVSEYIRDDNGHCLTDGIIKYFRVRPDTHANSCPAFWETAVGAAAKMNCKIGGTAVNSNNLDTAGVVGMPLDAGRLHTLSCDVLLTEDDTLIKTVTANTRCFRPGNVIEN